MVDDVRVQISVYSGYQRIYRSQMKTLADAIQEMNDLIEVKFSPNGHHRRQRRR